MADLFISYSRKDQEFVRRLHNALKERGKEGWVDWEGIPWSAEWLAEIKDAVAKSDAFVFVLTPDSLSSEICGDELDMALEQNKRIVPLLRREPDGVPVPDVLAKYNWIFFSDDEKFDTALAALVEALDTDLERTRLHTRLLVRSEEWEDRERESSRMLHGTDLREAEDFLAQEAQPEPTTLQRDYVAASRRAAVRRQRALLAGVSVALVVSAVLGIFALIQRGTAIARQKVAVSRGLAAIAVSKLDADPELSVLLASEAVRRKATPEADLALRRAVGADPLRALLSHGAPVREVAFSPDGKLVASASDDHTAKLWQARSGRLFHDLRGHMDSVNYAAFSPDGKLVATASNDGTARLWDVATGKPAGRPLDAGVALIKVLFTPDGTRVAGVGTDGALQAWNVATGAPAATLGQPSGDALTDAAFSPDGRSVVTGDQVGVVRLWDLRSGKARTLRTLAQSIAEAKAQALKASPLQAPPKNATAVVAKVAFSPDGKLIASGDDQGLTRLFSARGKAVATLNGDPPVGLLGFNLVDGIADLAFSPDGRFVAVAGIARGTARIFDTTSGSLVTTLPPQATLNSVRFSPDGRLVVTGGVEAKARISDAASGQSIAVLAGHTSNINSVTFSPDGSQVATGSSDSSARIWETYPGRQLTSAPIHQPQLFVAALSRDDRWLLTAGNDGNANLWDPRTGHRLTSAAVGVPIVDSELSDDGNWASIFTAAEQKVVDAATLGKRKSVTLAVSGTPQFTGATGISADGSRVVAGALDGSVRIWDGHSGRLLHTLLPPAAQGGSAPAVVQAHISRDGRTAIALTADNAITAYDTASGRRGPVLRSDGPASDAVISPDGRHVATIGTNPAGVTSPAVFDAVTGRRLFRTHADYGLFSAAFSRDSRLLVTAGIDGAVAIWDLSNGRRGQLQGRPAGPADTVDFSGDDRQVIVGGADGVARIFDVRSGLGMALLGGPSTTLAASTTLAGAQVGVIDGPIAVTALSGDTRTYACDVCGTTAHVQNVAKRLITRTLTRAERDQFLRGL